MFTWICPQCGREVPPSAAECPSCAETRTRAAQAAAQPPAAPQVPPQPQYVAPQHQAPQPQYPPQQQYPQQQQYQPPPPQYPQYQAPPQQPQPSYVIAEPKKGMPSWLVALLVTAVIGGGLFGVYKLMGDGTSNGKKADAPVFEKAAPAATGSGGGIYGKFLEVTAFRLLEDAAKKPKVRFTVVNHSPAPMSGLEMQVSLGRVGEETEPPFAVVDAKVGDVGPYATKEIELPIKTSLRVYELPDWQFIKGSFVVTAPK